MPKTTQTIGVGMLVCSQGRDDGRNNIHTPHPYISSYYFKTADQSDSTRFYDITVSVSGYVEATNTATSR